MINLQWTAHELSFLPQSHTIHEHAPMVVTHLILTLSSHMGVSCTPACLLQHPGSFFKAGGDKRGGGAVAGRQWPPSPSPFSIPSNPQHHPDGMALLSPHGPAARAPTTAPASNVYGWCGPLRARGGGEVGRAYSYCTRVRTVRSRRRRRLTATGGAGVGTTAARG